MVEKFCYTLIQFASMTVIMMGNMSVRFLSTICSRQLANYISKAQVSETEKLLNYIFLFCFTIFSTIFFCVRVSNDFQVQWMKINNWKQRLIKRALRFFYILTSTRHSTCSCFLPPSISLPFPDTYFFFVIFNYFLCEIMSISMSFQFFKVELLLLFTTEQVQKKVVLAMRAPAMRAGLVVY